MRGRKGPSWSVQVNCPSDKAYAYVADFLHHPDWAMDQMTISGDGPATVGSKYKAVGHLFNKPNPSTVTVTALDAPSSLEFEAQDAKTITGHVFTFAKQGNGTQVTRQLYAVEGPWYGIIQFLVFKSAIDKNFNGALAKLKERLEAAPA